MSEAELARVLIETPVDKLIELVKERGKVTLGKAASYLGVSEAQVEEWVKVLEERGFLRLMYPPIGEPYIVLAELSPAKIDHKLREFERKRGKIKGRVGQMSEKLSETEGRAETTDQKFVSLQEDLYKSLQEIETDLKNLDELEERRRSLISGAKEVQEYSQRATEHFDRVKSNLKELDKRIKEQLDELQKHEGSITDLESDRLRLEREMEVLDKEINLVRKLANAPRAPVLEEFKEILKKQKERTAKIRERKEEIHRKTHEIKKEVEKKRKTVRKKEVDHAKLILMKLTKPKKIRKRRSRKKVISRKRKVKVRKRRHRKTKPKKIKKKSKKPKRLRLTEVTR